MLKHRKDTLNIKQHYYNQDLLRIPITKVPKHIHQGGSKRKNHFLYLDSDFFNTLNQILNLY